MGHPFLPHIFCIDTGHPRTPPRAWGTPCCPTFSVEILGTPGPPHRHGAPLVAPHFLYRYWAPQDHPTGMGQPQSLRGLPSAHGGQVPGAVGPDPPLHLGALAGVGDGGDVLHDVLAGLRLARPALSWQGGKGLGEGTHPRVPPTRGCPPAAASPYPR